MIKYILRKLKTIKRYGVKFATIKFFEKILESLRCSGIFSLFRTKRLYSKDELAAFEFLKTESISTKIKFSIITPIYNTPERYFIECANSVISQIYDNWEWILVNASIENEKLSEILEEYAKKDYRIKIFSVEKNLGISENTNIGIKEASGEYIAFLDHDDLLAPNALFEVCSEIYKKGNIDLIYSDRDILTENSKNRIRPFYKPGFTLEMLFSANYIIHLTVFSKTILEDVGLLRKKMDGSQDWDLILRVAERTDNIVHIEKILYHWRTSPKSVASSIDAKPYALLAQLEVVNDYFYRLNKPVYANFIYNNTLKLSVEDSLEKYKIYFIIYGEDRRNRTYNSILSTVDDKVEICHIYTGFETIDAVNVELLKFEDGSYIVFVKAGVIFTEKSILELVQMASVFSKVGIIPKILKNKKYINSLGSIFDGQKYIELYNKYPKRYYGKYGYTDWYRSVNFSSGICICLSIETLRGLDTPNKNIQYSNFFIKRKLDKLKFFVNPFSEIIYNSPISKTNHYGSEVYEGGVKIWNRNIRNIL